MFEDHMTAETCTFTEGRGRVVWEWKVRPGQDNHWLDCVVGCFGGAADLGCRLAENRGAK